MQDSKKRVFHTLEGLEHWLALSPNLQIVICDGSDFDFEPLLSKKFPGRKIESLYFQNSSEEVQKNGVGYGEGEIIKYALKHSEYLHNSDYVIKCTGKLWVSNIQDCLNEWNSDFIANAHFLNIFSLHPIKIDYIDTRFYIFNKKFYIDNLLDSYKESSFGENKSIENIFLKVLLDLNIKGFIFSINPFIHGMSGASGTYYKNNLRRSLKNKLKKIILRGNKKFKDLIYFVRNKN